MWFLEVLCAKYNHWIQREFAHTRICIVDNALTVKWGPKAKSPGAQTQSKNYFFRSAPRRITEILPSSFMFFKLRYIWSFCVVVLQRNVMTQNARAGLLFSSLNLLSGDVLVHIVIVVCLSSLIVEVVRYSANGIIVSLTWGRNIHSGIFQNTYLFRNRVNRTHPKQVVSAFLRFFGDEF